MKATGILSKEHRAIEYLLAAMEMQAARLQSGAAVRPEFFLDAIVFLREFVDERHARKEEETLLVLLMDAGSPKDSGPIAEILAGNARAREITRNIEKNAQIVLGGGAGARADLARDATEYVTLLTRHIRSEETALFPLAEQMIPAGAQAELDAEFDRIENDYLEAGVHDKYYGIAEKLAEEAASG
jgi:hemerythrin-like domain-containing protein